MPSPSYRTICLFTSLLLLTALAPVVSRADEARERPNIVVIMVDDLGFADLGCYGSEIETPTLDRLAEEGLRLTHFYNTAKCHSSRVSLLTGLYCMQAGSSSLSRGVTVAEVLRESGYFTIMSGKWHLEEEPTDRGFDRYFGHLSGATNFFTGDDTFRLNGEKFTDFDEDFYTTDRDTDYALEFLDEARETEKPYFLYLAYNAPHYPLQAPKEDVMKYRGTYRQGWEALRKERYARQIDLGIIDPQWKLSPPLNHVRDWDSLSEKEKDWEDFRMAAFAGMVDRVDQNVARLVADLQEHGELENTFLLFCSDNGACPFERTRGREFMPWDARSYWTYDTGWAHAGNTPFRWYKQNQHEGGISSPCIIHWPEGLKAAPGTIDHQPAHLIDIMATAIDLGEADYPEQYGGRQIEPLQGKSLLPIIEGKQRPGHEWLYFIFSNNRAIRRGEWKLVSARGGPWELYQIEKDRTELNDLSEEKPELTAELSELWHRVAEEIDRVPERRRRPVKEKRQPWRGN